MIALLLVPLVVRSNDSQDRPPFEHAAEADAPLPQFGFEAPDGPEASADAVAADGPTDSSPFEGIADPPPPAPPGPLRPTEHAIAEGETVLSIADRYGLRPETIVWANSLDDPDLIIAGRKLRIPPTDGLLYTVDPGETLGSIASRYGLEMLAVAAANGLADPDLLSVGVELVLPGARPVAPSAVAARRQAPAAGQPSAPPEPDVQAASILARPLPGNLVQLLSVSWLEAEASTELYAAAAPGARRYTTLPAGARLERTGDLVGRRIPVRDPGDGTSRQAMSGWIDVDDLAPTRAPGPRELPRSYPAATRMDIAHVFAPFRTQLDGAPYAEANCGPTTIGMALEAFGIALSQPRLRAEVLDAQRMWGHNTGTLMTALAQVVEAHGLKTYGLRDREGKIDTWDLDDIRGQLRQGRPVVVQVRYRALPGREWARYYGDHYVLVTGVLDDGFLYNDPIDFDGTGWDRVISSERLYQAMDATDRRYRYAAFSVSR